jgi:hypothetical protein
MKLRLINSYKKRKTVKDPLTGKALIDPLTGKEVREDKPTIMFRYGVMTATPEESLLYKKFKLQDGAYYREEVIEGKKRALWHGEFIGKEITLKGYKREDGRIGFSVDTTENDMLNAMAAMYPDMAATFQAQAASNAMKGRTWNLEEKESDDEEDENAANEFAAVGEEPTGAETDEAGENEVENAE